MVQRYKELSPEECEIRRNYIPQVNKMFDELTLRVQDDLDDRGYIPEYVYWWKIRYLRRNEKHTMLGRSAIINFIWNDFVKYGEHFTSGLKYFISTCVTIMEINHFRKPSSRLYLPDSGKALTFYTHFDVEKLEVLREKSGMILADKNKQLHLFKKTNLPREYPSYERKK